MIFKLSKIDYTDTFKPMAIEPIKLNLGHNGDITDLLTGYMKPNNL